MLVTVRFLLAEHCHQKLTHQASQLQYALIGKYFIRGSGLLNLRKGIHCTRQS